MKKISSTYSDVVASFVPRVTSILPGGPLSSTLRIGANAARIGGDVHGLTSKAPDLKLLLLMNKNKAKAFIPGVASSRLLRRRKAQGAPTGTILSLRFGGLTSAGLLAMIGLSVGLSKGLTTSTATDNKATSKMVNALTGLGTGLALGTVLHGIGGLTAAITPTRTYKEQSLYDKENSTGSLLNWFIPGVASYNKYKSYGRMIDDLLRNAGQLLENKQNV